MKIIDSIKLGSTIGLILVCVVFLKVSVDMITPRLELLSKLISISELTPEFGLLIICLNLFLIMYAIKLFLNLIFRVYGLIQDIDIKKKSETV